MRKGVVHKIGDKRSFIQRVLVKKNSCWLWIGAKNGYGYGIFSIDGKNQSAHRYSYEKFNGKILPGLQIDHLCRIRNCVNPTHLEAVTAKTNILRGEGLAAVNARKTHCAKGHLYDYVDTKQRRCKKCNVAYSMRRYWKLKGVRG